MRILWLLLALFAWSGRSVADAVQPPAWIAAARSQIGVTLHYDPAYTRLGYPGGDVPITRGVCTDVVIRALRTQGLDLQKAVHEDMATAFAAYPKRWNLKRPDRNIDHRRVPNLETWMRRQGWEIDGSSVQAGDLVTWLLPGNLPHIGIVSDRFNADGSRPLVLHNIGAGTQEEDVLAQWPRVGVFRPRLGSSE